jgi:hypothetical protein
VCTVPATDRCCAERRRARTHSRRSIEIWRPPRHNGTAAQNSQIIAPDAGTSAARMAAQARCRCERLIEIADALLIARDHPLATKLRF